MGCGGSAYDKIPQLRQFKEEYDHLGLTPQNITSLYNNSYALNVIKEGEDMDLQRFCASFKIVKDEQIKMMRLLFHMGSKDSQVAFKDFAYGCWSICTISSKNRKYLMAFIGLLYADVNDPKIKNKKIGLTFKRIYEMVNDTAGNPQRESDRWKKIIREITECKDRTWVSFDEIDGYYDEDAGVAELPFQFFIFNLQLLLFPTLSKQTWDALEARRFKMHKDYMEADEWVERERNKNWAIVDTSRFSIRMSVWQGKNGNNNNGFAKVNKVVNKESSDDVDNGRSKKKKKSPQHGEGVMRRVTKMLSIQGAKKNSKIVTSDNVRGSDSNEKNQRSNGPSKGGGGSIAARVKRMSMAVTNKVGAAVGRKKK